MRASAALPVVLLVGLLSCSVMVGDVDNLVGERGPSFPNGDASDRDGDAQSQAPQDAAPDGGSAEGGQSDAAPPVAGCVNGSLVDPKAYFFSLINRTEGTPATGWQTVLSASGLPQGPVPGQKSDPSKFYGIAQAIGGGGPAGRIFLPTDTADANGYFTHPVDVLKGDQSALEWAWNDLGGPPYAPRSCP